MENANAPEMEPEMTRNAKTQPPTTTPTCPVCGGSGIPIAYGLPPYDMFKAEERGEVVLGGCEWRPGARDHRCSSCGHEWLMTPVDYTDLDPATLIFLIDGGNEGAVKYINGLTADQVKAKFAAEGT
jgi:hypothetical protein